MNLFENEDGTPRRLSREEAEYLELTLGKMINDLKSFGSFIDFRKNMKNINDIDIEKFKLN